MMNEKQQQLKTKTHSYRRQQHFYIFMNGVYEGHLFYAREKNHIEELMKDYVRTFRKGKERQQ